ncbi:MAG TPA: TonB-dependent receptor [Candidatus Dormibacteraeota bacterium]|nr:TonB-dependent receptor [Candidatus Dormibacteraeota bacterium]
MTASIAGKITVKASEGVSNNLSGITVTLMGPASGSSAQTAFTNSEGHYEFTHLAEGTYTVSVTMSGFKPWTSKVILRAGQQSVQDAVLQLSAVEENVEVKGEATEVETQSVSATATVNQQQLASLPLRTGKFTEALSVSPSVIKTQEGRLNFNGQSESQAMLLVDSAENVDPVSGSFGIPIPVDAIQSIQVFSTPDSAAYGGFSGGLTKIDIRPPSPVWNYKILDFLPSFRAKNGSLVGLANITPRVEFGGPLIKDKFNFSEDLSYVFRRDPVHGLTWPYNETYIYSFTSFTQFQWTLSSRHLLSANVNVFPSTNLYANINALIPQSASVDFQRRGVSIGLSDDYQFNSGAVLNTVVRYTNYYSNAHGQGPADMTISPEGWGGNFFNTWWRNANQVEALPILQLPEKSWLGHHELKFGGDILYRGFDSRSVSHPIELLAQDSSVAEQINFQGPGLLNAADTEVSGYAEDQWRLNDRLSATLGGRLTTQSIGREFSFSPRVGLAYNFGDGKTVLRAGTGIIRGHVPLLAADFADNQARVITYSSGPFAGQPITLQNAYMPSGTGAGARGPEDLGNSPRTFTWNVEVSTQLRKNITLRMNYYETSTTDLFIVNPILPDSGTLGTLALENTGTAHYRQAQVVARYRPNDRTEWNVSYSWSRARGDLNSLSDTFIPFESPVLRPNVYGVQPSDIPHRVLAWGFLHLPMQLVVSPVADIHSGFPYSNVDVLQNYVGAPNSLRFPVYFSMDVKVYRDFNLHLPFMDRGKTRKIRLGVYSLDITNRHNPHDVYSNVASPIFGQFAGFQRRFTGFAIGLGE